MVIMKPEIWRNIKPAEQSSSHVRMTTNAKQAPNTLPLPGHCCSPFGDALPPRSLHVGPRFHLLDFGLWGIFQQPTTNSLTLWTPAGRQIKEFSSILTLTPRDSIRLCRLRAHSHKAARTSDASSSGVPTLPTLLPSHLHIWGFP